MSKKWQCKQVPIQFSFVAQGASVLNFQSDGNSKNGCEIISILKKFKKMPIPPTSTNAPEWQECQKSRIERLRSRLLMWRFSPESMRDDVENSHMLLCRFVAGALQRELSCDPGVRRSRAPWSALLDRGGPTSQKQRRFE